VLSDRSTATSESVTVRAGTGGSLVFARLAWPGYTATLDGEPVDVRDGPAGLLAVDVPAGARHDLEIAFRSPGLAQGVDVLAAAALLSLVQSAGWLVARWRRGQRSVTPPADAGARLEPDAGDERREDVVPAGTSGR